MDILKAFKHAWKGHIVDTMHTNGYFLIMAFPTMSYLFKEFNDSNWWIGFAWMGVINFLTFIDNMHDYYMHIYPTEGEKDGFLLEQSARNIKIKATQRVFQCMGSELGGILGCWYFVLIVASYVFHPSPLVADQADSFERLLVLWVLWCILFVLATHLLYRQEEKWALFEERNA